MKTRAGPVWSALAAAVFGGAAALAATDSVGAAGERRAVSAFDRIMLDAPAELRVTQGAVETLAVEAEAHLLPLLRTRVDAGTLRIDLAGPVRTQVPLRVHVTLRTLRHLQADGAGEVRVGPLHTSALAVELGGSSSAQVAGLTADRLDLRLTGSSRLQIGRGAVRQFQAHIADAASCDAPGLRSADARLNLAGSGQARVQATQRLDAVVADGASLRYAGSPRLTQQLSGAADVLHEPVETP